MRPCGGCGKMVENVEGQLVNVDNRKLHECCADYPEVSLGTQCDVCGTTIGKIFTIAINKHASISFCEERCWTSLKNMLP